jgi:hypothetical protein
MIGWHSLFRAARQEHEGALRLHHHLRAKTHVMGGPREMRTARDVVGRRMPGNGVTLFRSRRAGERA